MRVLIAEDSEVTRRLLASQLERWGYTVVAVNDGAEAWRELQRPDAPRMAILDWMMPGMDGVDVCRMVRALNAEPYIYIVLLTGRDRRQDIVRGLSAGADDYITKPFDAQELEVRARAGRRIVDLNAQLVAAREQLAVEASHDALTGLLNRGALLKTLGRDCSRATREGTPLALVMVDLDHFKNINDTFGHAAGDQVLRETARRMLEALRPYDVLARYGGEEFLLLLPACGRDEAVVVAERLRACVGTQPIVLPDGQTLKVSCSAGVASADPAAEIDGLTVIAEADAALYRAKAAGRDRVGL